MVSLPPFVLYLYLFLFVLYNFISGVNFTSSVFSAFLLQIRLIIKLIRIAIAFVWIYFLQRQSRYLWLKSINFKNLKRYLFRTVVRYRKKNCPLTQPIRLQECVGFRSLTINKKINTVISDSPDLESPVVAWIWIWQTCSQSLSENLSRSLC